MTLSVAVAGTYRTVVAKSVAVAGAWRTVTGEWVGVAGVWRQVFSSAIYTAITGSAYTNHIGGGVTTVTLTVNRAGTWQLTTNDSGGETITPLGVQTWVTPNAADSGDTRWVHVANAGPDAVSGTTGAWVALSSNQVWTLSVPAASSNNATLTVRIAADAAGAAVLSTGSVFLEADND